jgi:HAE1 family hydrophobic/amphiphilic exporter-1
MAELEENLKVYQVQILNSFQPPWYRVMELPEGFELRLSGMQVQVIIKNGGHHNDFVKELNKRPELSNVFSFFSRFPQYM